MDDYLFKFHVAGCRHVFEETQYLEIYTYSDSRYNTVVENLLPLDQFDDFLSQTGTFARRSVPNDVTQVAGLRMMFVKNLQQNASHPETFYPSVISLPLGKYSRMMAEFHLPYKVIECSSTVGPLFWTGYDEPQKILQMVYRKADVKENGAFRGWELLLSYNLASNTTTAFCKGNQNSYIAKCVKHIKAAWEEIAHPMLFPIIVFSHHYSASSELRQRDARKGLRRLETALTHDWEASGVQDRYVDQQGLVNFDQIITELTVCHKLVLKKSPFTNLRVLDGFDEAMSLFEKQSKRHRSVQNGDWQRDTHMRFSSRIDFYRKKLHGQEQFQSITLQRLEVQRSAISMSCCQIDNRVSFQIASAQTKLAHSSKREAVSQKAIAILGTVFLPGAYLSSLFSTTFFNWQAQSSTSNSPSVSPLFWIYWAVSIPFTVAVVGSYVLWDWKLSKKACKEDEAIELRMLDMKRNSQNQAIRIAAGVTLGSGGLMEKV